MSGKFFEAIKQLFPRSRAFELFADNSKRKLIKGIAELPENIRREAELVYLDLFPDTFFTEAELSKAQGHTGLNVENARRKPGRFVS